MKKILRFIRASYLWASPSRTARTLALLLSSANLFCATNTSPDCQNYGNGQAQNIVYTVNGNTVTTLSGHVSAGDVVSVCFTLSAGCDSTIFSLVSYKAPSSTFNSSTATLQTVFDMDSKTLIGSGTHCLTVTIPSCYFQVDFVVGCVIYQLGPPGSGNYYSDQGRLIDGDNGGSGTCNCVAQADAGANINMSCTTTTVTLNGSTYVHNPVVSWLAINGGHIVSGGNTLSPVVNSAGTYILSVTDSLQCTATDSVMVTGGPLTVHLGNDTTLCAGSTLVLNAGNSGCTYLWSTSATTQTISVSASGTYYVSVTIGNCTASDTIHVTVLPPLTVNLGNDTTLCAGSTLVLDAGNSGCTYMWSTGATTQTITVSSSGTYYVTVTKGNCTASDTIHVTVLPPLTVHLCQDTTLCAGSTLVLNAGNSGCTYMWSTGATTQTISVSASGTYYVTVTKGNCTASDTVHVVVLPPVTVNLGNDTTVVFCQGSLLLNAGNPGSIYLWSTGATTQTISVTSTGTYSVLVTNFAGCIGSDSIHITVNPGHLSVNLGNDTMFVTCTHQTLTLDAGVSGAVYVWSTGAVSQTITVDTTGVYYVNVTDSLGCMASDTISVIIYDNTIIVDLGPDTTVCGCILLYAGYPGATYSWCSGQNYSTINACWTGVYCVTVSNGTCMDSDSIHVTVNPVPMVNLGNDTVLVSGSLTLNAGNGGSTYLWNTGATTQTITVTASGTYYVTVTNGFGCSATDTIHISILNGVAQYALPAKLSVYPNPAKNKSFTIGFENSTEEAIEIQVINSLGIHVFTEKLDNFKGTYKKAISLESHPAGLYFVTILRNNKRNVVKMVLD